MQLARRLTKRSMLRPTAQASIPALRTAAPVPALFSLLAERADTRGAATNSRAHLEATLFVANPVYGTRSSTVVLLDARGELTFIERRFDPDGKLVGETAHTFASSRSGTPASAS